MKAVRAHGSCTMSELAAQLEVSDETIRRNIKPLVSKGLVLKVHGGIVLPDHLEEPPYQRRMQENKEAKQRIAALVAGLIKDGDSLMLDGGTTNVYIAQALREHSRLIVVTNSAEIARILAPRNNNRVFMAGGELRADDAAAFGESVLAFIRQFQVKYAILSVSVLNANGEVMYFQLCDAEFSRAAVAQAGQAIMVADHSKLGREAVIKAFGLEAIDMLITDQAPVETLAKRFAEAGIPVMFDQPSD